MKLFVNSPVQSLNKAYRKVGIPKPEFDNFNTQLAAYIGNINESESEEHLKTPLRDFLRDTFYSDNEINTDNRTDLVIYLGANDQSNVGVLIETKRPNNKTEMISQDSFNKKAMHEAILYYLRERIEKGNKEIKHIIITDFFNFYVFDATNFESIFYKGLAKQFNKWNDGQFTGEKTDYFYNEIAKPFISESKSELPCTYFDIRPYKQMIGQDDKKKLISLFKFFSTPHILKESFANDSNSINKPFYYELLHIIGLEEVTEKGKKLIRRLKEEKRSNSSLLENTIKNLKVEDVLSGISNLNEFGETTEDQLFNIALELNITWINRILFLKLLEAQLLSYNRNKSVKFLDISIIKEFDDLNELFFGVLAKTIPERDSDIRDEFVQLPFLNSSLFEINSIESKALRINSLRDRYKLKLHSQTVLKDTKGRRMSGEMQTLEYLFKFLDAFDFSSEGAEDVKEDTKSLINASVLGLIFEKINGYKEGSFFTPGYITMYICRETIRRAVLQKFKDKKGLECENIDQLYNKIKDLKEANRIINSIKICDPAVGSGHFLVSALNEIISIKSELGVLCYHGTERRVKDYKIEIHNDELIVTDENDDIFEYKMNDKGRPVDTNNEQLLQETLFHEKETIIENCLFGVDINPNSVNICRLRLWIELLKNTYYTEESGYKELETLPNIDINIKCGNSLVSRFDLQDGAISLQDKRVMESYKLAVAAYKNVKDRDERRELTNLIESIKKKFSGMLSHDNPKEIRKMELATELHSLNTQIGTFGLSQKEQKRIDKIQKEMEKLRDEINKDSRSPLYANAFEWRFEFPEVLDDDGKFIGFDAVIGNPPYGVKLKSHFRKYYEDFYQLNITDTAALFISLMNKIRRKKSFGSFIIPKAFTYASNWKKVVEKYFGEIFIIVDCGKVWKDVKLEQTVFVTQDKTTKSYFNYKRVEDNIVFLDKISKKDCDLFGLILNSINKNELEIGIKIKSTKSVLNDFMINKRGAPYQKSISAELGDKKVIGGKEINRFLQVRHHQGWITNDNIIDEHSKINENAILIQNIVAHIQNPVDHIKIIATILEDKDFIILDTINQLTNISDISTNFFLALLSSQLVNWYVYRFLFAKAIRTMHFDNPVTSRIPIPKIDFYSPVDVEMHDKIVTLADEILSAKKADPKADTNRQEAEIDRLVYKLYDLTDEEIAIVEGAG